MYQTMSPDNLVSTSLRRSNTSNFKSSKEEHQNYGENGRIAVTSTTTTSFEGDEQQQQDTHNHHNNNHNHASTSAVNHEMLLNWGPRKRSRCSRSDGRSMVSVFMDNKYHTAKTAAAATTNHVMPPPHPNPNLPSTSSNGCRSGSSTRVRPHGLLHSKDTSAFLPSKNRHLVDQMGINNASPSRNGGGGGSSSRPISRSTVGKRSPSCIEKNDNSKKICSGSGAIRKVKSDDSLTPSTATATATTNTNGNGNYHDLTAAHGDRREHGVGGGHGSSAIRSPVRDTEKGSELVEWPRIYLSLSRKEKEDDFYAMKGTKLPHRPKKRAKAVDRALQYCFPGLWLSDLTRARYEVRERKSAKKPKRRGLKGLETMESDSE